ncbi:MAG: murein hydrolase activator EnvC family protein [Candidatus Sericytochromatia bacterium]
MKKTLTLALVLALAAGYAPAQAAPSLTAKQRQLQAQQYQLNRKLNAQRARLNYLKQKESHEVKALSSLQQKLEQTATELQDSQYRLRRAEVKLTVAQTKLQEAKRDFERQQGASAARLRAIYKHKALDQWEALLTSPDMTTFLTRYHYFKRISEHDSTLLEDLDRRRKVIIQQQRQYAQQRQNMARITEMIGSQKIQLSDLTEDQAKLVAKIKSERQSAEEVTKQLEADSNQIEAMIRRLIAQRRAQDARNRGSRPPMGTGRFAWPCAGVVTSPFGFRMHPILKRQIGHHGIDFGAYSGTPIFAADNAEVLYVGWYGGYGKVVILDHGGDLTTLYGHTSSYVVSAGQRIRKGQLIAYVGSTGMSTGPHLHFEVRKNGTPVNPMNYLR